MLPWSRWGLTLRYVATLGQPRRLVVARSHGGDHESAGTGVRPSVRVAAVNPDNPSGLPTGLRGQRFAHWSAGS